MNADAQHNLINRSFKATPKVKVRFKKYNAHYDTTTGESQDTNNGYELDAVLKKKFKNKTVPESTLFQLLIPTELFIEVPAINDIFEFDNVNYTIGSFEISMGDTLYVMNMVA